MSHPIPNLVLTGHREAVWHGGFSLDGLRIASASCDHTIKLWDGLTGVLQASLIGHRNWVRACGFSPDGTRLVSGSRDRTLKVWDTETGAELSTISGHWDEVIRVTYCLDGARIASGSLDGSVSLWDAETRREIATMGGAPAPVRILVRSPNGRLVCAGRDQRVTVWDVDSVVETAQLEHSDLVRACAFSPDGARVLSGAGRGTLKLWEAQTGRAVASFIGHSNFITDCGFAPDGQRIASASSDQTLRLWDMKTTTATAVLAGHTGEVTACGFSPDGRYLVSAARDRTLRVWDAITGTLVATLSGHTDEVRGCAFSPDGTRLVSWSSDGTLRLWMLESLARQPALRPPSGTASKGYGPKLFAFLSYRRESGAETARLIRAELRARGLNSFLDVEDLGAYHFDDRLLRRIEEAPHFILVLSPGSLERCANPDDWLRREISHAITNQRNIVPVLKEGFGFPPKETLPAELADLSCYNCVEYSHVYFQATINRVLEFCGIAPG